MASPTTDSKSAMDEEDLEGSNDLVSTGEFSVTNPFESQQTIDSLLQPSFSPSVFTVGSPPIGSAQATSSFWTIDEIAVLKPANIDVSALHSQQNFVCLDPASEMRAQQAIDEFFTSRIEMPSPWSSDRSNNHYLALISPSPAQMKKKNNAGTPVTAKYAVSSSCSSSSSQMRVRRLALSNLKNRPQSSLKLSGRKKDFDRLKESKNVSTQTTLTLPRDFDLESILSQYFTYGNLKENVNESGGNTSLRRKLFFPDGREVGTRDRHGGINLNALQHIDDINDIDEIIHSPVELQKITPVKNNLTPLNHYGAQLDRSRTPSTCQSHYSSSPMHSGEPFDVRTPTSSDIRAHKFGSGLRHCRKLGASKMEDISGLSSPEVSPVKGGIFEVTKSPLYDSPPNDESMPFQVCEEVNKSDALEESSRRQLVLEMPPISPIQPIKHKKNPAKTSGDNVESTHQNLSVPASPNEPSGSMLQSPPSQECDNYLPKCEREQKLSILSSTVTRPKHCAEKHASEVRPFRNYEMISGEDKENIPEIASSCAISMQEFGEDVSMLSYHTPNCHERNESVSYEPFLVKNSPVLFQSDPAKGFTHKFEEFRSREPKNEGVMSDVHGTQDSGYSTTRCNQQQF